MDDVDDLQAQLASYVLAKPDNKKQVTNLKHRLQVSKWNEELIDSLERYDCEYNRLEPRTVTPDIVPTRPGTAAPRKWRPSARDIVPLTSECCGVDEYEESLLKQIDEMREEICTVQQETQKQEEHYASLFQRASTRKKKAGSSALHVSIAMLRKKVSSVAPVRSLIKSKRVALEKQLMELHDVGSTLRRDMLKAPTCPAAFVVSSHFPQEVCDVIQNEVYNRHGYVAPFTEFMAVFESICDVLEWVKVSQGILARYGWGGEVINGSEAIPQLSCGISFGDAEMVETREGVTYKGPVVQRAALLRGKAMGGEAYLCNSAAAELEAIRASINNPLPMLQGMQMLKAEDGIVLVAQGAAIKRNGARGAVAKQRGPREIEVRLASLEQARMVLEDQQIKRTAPSGVVTVVFTDVQSSTSLWDTCPNAMRIALQKHNRLFLNLLEIYGGYAVKTEGDAFMIAFSDAANAMHWCMQTQLHLLKENWPPEIIESPEGENMYVDGVLVFHGLRVRMGFTTGEPECTTDVLTGRMDYFGPMVNLAARIAGQGKGGETIIGSSAMAALKRCKALPSPDVAVTGKGTKSLKGISKSETMFQLVPVGLTGRKDSQQDAPKADRQCAWADAVFNARKKKRAQQALSADTLRRYLDMEKVYPKLIRKYRSIRRTIEAKEAKLMRCEDTMTADIPPTGSVTIVFTDIQDSTSLWEADAARMSLVLHMHNKLLRSLIKEHEGYEVKTEGDAFMVAFPSPLYALNWCVAAQLALLTEPWPEPSPVYYENVMIFNGPRVRMGLNTGEPNCDIDRITCRMDYHGRIVNNAARVSGTAQGGDIAMGLGTYTELLRLDEESGNIFGCLSLKSKGSVHLKGISTAEMIHSVLPLSLAGRRLYWKKEGNKQQAKAIVGRMEQAKYEEYRAPNELQLLGHHEKVMEKVFAVHEILNKPFSLTRQEISDVYPEMMSVVKYVTILTRTLTEHDESKGDWEETLANLICKLTTIIGNDPEGVPFQTLSRSMRSRKSMRR